MIELKNVSFIYKSSESKNGIKNINLKIKDGEAVLICGTSGCGKTTLTRLINGLIPNYYEGELSGDILINGKSTKNMKLYEISQYVGSVFQNPRSQFFNVETTSEIAFGCENIGISPNIIKKRLEHVVEEFKIDNLIGKNIFHLSGGQKQKIACASVSTMMPNIFVLDEPSSNLDINSICNLSKVMKRWKQNNKTIIVSEHRLHYLANIVDRVLYMNKGEIIYDMSSEKFFDLPLEKISNLGLRSLKHMNFDQKKECLYKKDKIQLCDFDFSYKKNKILDISNLEIPDKSIVGILGDNGAGKSTFVRCLCGLLKSKKSKILFKSRSYNSKQRLKLCYMVMQDVNHQLFTESVLDEILLSMEDNDEEENEKEAENILKSLNLLDKKELHPMSLSGGEKQRVAIGSAIASDKQILIFDEPTSGLDLKHMNEVADNLFKLNSLGKTLLVVTHDLELVNKVCDYIIFMKNGKVDWAGNLCDKIEKVEKFFKI